MLRVNPLSKALYLAHLLFDNAHLGLKIVTINTLKENPFPRCPITGDNVFCETSRYPQSLAMAWTGTDFWSFVSSLFVFSVVIKGTNGNCFGNLTHIKEISTNFDEIISFLKFHTPLIIF